MNVSLKDCLDRFAETSDHYCTLSVGGLVTAMIATILLVSAVSVLIHLVIYCWVYKPRMKSRREVAIHYDTIDDTMAAVGDDDTTSIAVLHERSEVVDLERNVAYKTKSRSIPLGTQMDEEEIIMSYESIDMLHERNEVTDLERNVAYRTKSRSNPLSTQMDVGERVMLYESIDMPHERSEVTDLERNVAYRTKSRSIPLGTQMDVGERVMSYTYEPMNYEATAVDNDIIVTTSTPSLTDEKSLDSVDLEINVAYQFDTVSLPTTESDGTRELCRSVSVSGEDGPTLGKRAQGVVRPAIPPKPKGNVVYKVRSPPINGEVEDDDLGPTVKVKVKDANSISPGKPEVKQEYSTKLNVKERKECSSLSFTASAKDDDSLSSAELNQLTNKFNS